MSHTTTISMGDLLTRIKALEDEVAALKGRQERSDVLDRRFGPNEYPFTPAPFVPMMPHVTPRTMPDPVIAPIQQPWITIPMWPDPRTSDAASPLDPRMTAAGLFWDPITRFNGACDMGAIKVADGPRTLMTMLNQEHLEEPE